MQFKHRHWTAALLAATLLQLALAAMLYPAHPEGTSDLPGGVEIEIGSAFAGAAGKVNQPAPETADLPHPIQPVRRDSSAAASKDISKQTALSEQELHESASLAETAEAVAIKSPPIPTNRAKPATRRQALPPAERKLSQTKVQKPGPKQSGRAASETASEASANAAGSVAAITPGSSAAKGNADAAKVSPEYYLKLAAWLERHKHYPRRAVQRRQQGVVKVSFRIDRQGNLLSREIIQGSGYPLLDEAADSLLQRASPMPGIPQQSSAQVLEVIVPISYALR